MHILNKQMEGIVLILQPPEFGHVSHTTGVNFLQYTVAVLV